MKQAKSILVQHRIQVEKSKKKIKNQKRNNQPTNQPTKKNQRNKQKKALIGFSVTISQMKGI